MTTPLDRIEKRLTEIESRLAERERTGMNRKDIADMVQVMSHNMIASAKIDMVEMAERVATETINKTLYKDGQSIVLVTAREASNEIFTKVMATWGVNAANFSDMMEFRKALDWAKRSQSISDAAGRRVTMGVIMAGATGVGIGAWEYFKSLIVGHS